MEKVKVMMLCKKVPNVFRNRFSVTSVKYDNISAVSYFRKGNDFIFIGNDFRKDSYDDLVNEIRTVIKDTPFITTKSTQRTIASIVLDKTWYYVEPAMESLKINDDIFNFVNDDFGTISNTINMFKLASRPGIPNINGWTYTEEAYDTALNSKYIKELIKNKGLEVEYGSSKTKCLTVERSNTIDPSMVIGNVVAVSNKYLFVKEGPKYYEYLGLHLDTKYFAYMRYTAKHHANYIVTDMDITTWDIWENELSEEYLATIE